MTIGIITATGERLRLCRQITMKDGVKCWSNFDDDRKIPVDEISFPPSDKTEFLRELKALLEKYNAEINWDCSSWSDLAGVYDDHLEIDMNGMTTIPFNYNYIDIESIDKLLDSDEV